MTYPRTSPLHRCLESLDPVWGELHAMQVPLHFGDAEGERSRSEDLALGDLSALPKLGLKGPRAEEWLREHEIPVPPQVYDWVLVPRGVLVLRTDRSEFLVEDGFSSRRVLPLSEKLGSPSHPGVHPVPHQEAGLVLTGRRWGRVLLQTCGYDFEKGGGKLVMSRVAGVSCALLKTEFDGIPALRIWCSPSYGVYLWESLLEIVRELGGIPVGVAALAGAGGAWDAGD